MNNYNITGEYWIFQDEKLILHEHNLITSEGENYFLQKAINSRSDVITELWIGTGAVTPNKSIATTDITNKKSSAVNKKVEDNQIILSTSFDAATINNTTQIAIVTDDEKLISYNLHDPISIVADSTITIVYAYSLSTGEKITTWKQFSSSTVTFYITDNTEVIAVTEADTGIGYKKAVTESEVETTKGSYYWNSIEKKLYIHTSDDLSPSTHIIHVTY